MEIINNMFSQVQTFSNVYKKDNRGRTSIVYTEHDCNSININFRIIEERIYKPEIGAFFGIHFQNNPMKQNKLITLINGTGTDYLVDLRKNSTTYKKWIKFELSFDSINSIYIPHGFGHAFIATSNNVIMCYRIDQYHDKNYSRAISYKDPEINLEVMINEALLSEQDKNAPNLANSDCNL